jgi:hypothetical protein
MSRCGYGNTTLRKLAALLSSGKDRMRCILLSDDERKINFSHCGGVYICIYIYYGERQDSAVGISTDYGLDGRRSNPSRATLFSSPQRSDWLWGPTSFLSNWYWEVLSPGVKWQEREANQFFQFSAEIKKNGTISPLLICLPGTEIK